MSNKVRRTWAAQWSCGCAQTDLTPLSVALPCVGSMQAGRRTTLVNHLDMPNDRQAVTIQLPLRDTRKAATVFLGIFVRSPHMLCSIQALVCY